MALKKNEKIGVFVAVILAFAFIVFVASLFGSDDNLSLSDVNLANPSGGGFETPNLAVEDLVIGDGAEAVSGSVVTVHYIGALDDGTEFDSSMDRSPFSFLLGGGQVIAGWDLGIEGMKVGGTRVLVIPPELGYGSSGAGPIPPNSTLIFQVELLEVNNP